MIAGPKVDIYVGPSMKHYNLPKLLLCHYSDYFDRCFNGEFAEGESQKLTLPEDNIADFEVLLEYMLRGSVSYPIVVTEEGAEAVKRCMDFLEYADKYNLGGACDAAHDALKRALTEPHYPSIGWGGNASVPTIDEANIELVYRIALPDSKLRTLAAQAALSTKGFQHIFEFEKQIDEVPGFASQLIKQMVESLITRAGSNIWEDPLTGRAKTL